MDTQFDWASALAKLISRLEVNNLGTRRKLYESAYSAQDSFIKEEGASLDIEDVTFMKKILRYTIIAIERDIRAGVDIAAVDYTPRGLDEIADALKTERDIRQSRRQASALRQRSAGSSVESEATPEQILSEQDQARLSRLQVGLAMVDPRDRQKVRKTTIRSPVAIVRALLIQNLLLIKSESRIALLWTLIMPTVMLTIISGIYFLTGTSFVLGMDVPTFALIGAVTWLMSRQVIFRVSGTFAHSRMWIHIPLVTPLHITVAQALISLVIFSFAFVVLLTAGHHIGMLTLPNNIPRFLAPVFGMLIFAYGVGLIFGSIACFWPYFLRFASMIERTTQMFSSLLFVSEQLPEDWKGYVLWLPTAHGMQLVRAGYFATYTAPDASPRYFAESVAASLLIGLFAAWVTRPRMEPM